MILLFGANGQLGRELTRGSAARAVPLVALSHAEADIADEAAVRATISRHKPSLVVNAAATYAGNTMIGVAPSTSGGTIQLGVLNGLPTGTTVCIHAPTRPR